MAPDVSPDVPSVLLVEDQQDDRAMYAEYLRLRGFDPIEIATTDEAVPRAADSDVIVTGIRVSGSFDGLELVRRLRADIRTSSKPVIVLTAWAIEPAREQAVAAGCDLFLPKPCLPDVLVTEIQRVLALRSGPRPRAARLRSRRAKGNSKVA
jgi:CheY-like chemotaxis protein